MVVISRQFTVLSLLWSVYSAQQEKLRNLWQKLAIGYWLLAVRCWLLVVFSRQFTVISQQTICVNPPQCFLLGYNPGQKDLVKTQVDAWP